MKTAVSIPDELFDEAEQLAERLNLNRSQLFVRALEEFVSREGEDPVTGKLNEIASEVETSGGVEATALGRHLVESGGWEW